MEMNSVTDLGSDSYSRFYIVLESESEFVPESVSGNINEPLYCVMCVGALIV